MMTTQKRLGSIEIAPQVIESIAGIAASHIPGFHPAKGYFYSGMNALLGRDRLANGVVLTEVDNEYVIDVYGAVNYGVSVPKLALALQEKIKEQLLFSCELSISEVNVHVTSIIPAKAEAVEEYELEADEE